MPFLYFYIALFLAEASSKHFTYYYPWQTCSIRHLLNYMSPSTPGPTHLDLDDPLPLTPRLKKSKMKHILAEQVYCSGQISLACDDLTCRPGLSHANLSAFCTGDAFTYGVRISHADSVS